MELSKILNSEIKRMLEEKKIYFTFAYVGQLRCYKHNELIWWADAPYTVNEQGVHFDYPTLYKKGEECLAYFLEHSYIPNMENVNETIREPATQL